MSITLHDVIDVIEEVTEGDANEAYAGGTYAPWATDVHGLAVVVTDEDGPFAPDRNWRVRGEAFLVGIYASAEAWLDGHDPLDMTTCSFDLDELRRVIPARIDHVRSQS